MKPFFSVLVPLYNAAPFIGECLDSVMAQTFTDWECLVVDDASTDSSWQIIREKVRSNYRFQREQNAERVTALPNLMDMIRRTEGEVCAILDGDDYLLPHALQTAHDLYKSDPSIVATSGQYRRFPDGGTGHCEPYKADWIKAWQFGHLLTAERDILQTTIDKYPDAFIDPTTGRPWTKAYDLALWYGVVRWAERHGKKIAHNPDPIYVYRRYDQNDDSTPEGLQEQIRCAEAIKKYWEERR